MAPSAPPPPKQPWPPQSPQSNPKLMLELNSVPSKGSFGLVQHITPAASLVHSNVPHHCNPGHFLSRPGHSPNTKRTPHPPALTCL
jgi:hypothetical protein